MEEMRPRQAGYFDPDIDILRIGGGGANVIDYPADAEVDTGGLRPNLGKFGGRTGHREATEQFVGIAGRCFAARETLLHIIRGLAEVWLHAMADAVRAPLRPGASATR